MAIAIASAAAEAPPPPKPLSPFFLFCRAERAAVAAGVRGEGPAAAGTASVNKALGERWRLLPDARRAAFVSEAAAAKDKYMAAQHAPIAGGDGGAVVVINTDDDDDDPVSVRECAAVAGRDRC